MRKTHDEVESKVGVICFVRLGDSSVERARELVIAWSFADEPVPFNYEEREQMKSLLITLWDISETRMSYARA